jgi:hypothetical protein
MGLAVVVVRGQLVVTEPHRLVALEGTELHRLLPDHLSPMLEEAVVVAITQLLLRLAEQEAEELGQEAEHLPQQGEQLIREAEAVVQRAPLTPQAAPAAPVS